MTAHRSTASFPTAAAFSGFNLRTLPPASAFAEKGAAPRGGLSANRIAAPAGGLAAERIA